MRRQFLKSMLAALPLGWWMTSAGVSPRKESAMQDPAQKDHDAVVAAFDLAALKDQQAAGARPYLPFFENATMRMGLYVLAAGARDTQSPHAQDEVYYIDEGRGVLRVEGRDHPVRRGSVVFVRAKAAHHFHSIEEDLKVLVFFSKAAPT